MLGATVFWGASFILTKALGDLQASLSPGADSWLLSSLSLFLRFGGGAMVLLAWNARRLGRLTRLETRQGVGMGIFGGVGILFQMDGDLHTKASTCAFLTQCYCVFIPLFLVWRHRKLPALRLAASCVMALAGVAVLSGITWAEFHLGRGESETILSSVFFTAQILWLERSVFAGNDSRRMTVVMFVVSALVMLPTLFTHSEGPRQWAALYASPAALGLILFLMLGCSVVAYSVMNEWQPHIPATEAGLIYCCEPMFAAIFALFLPACLERWTGVRYPNEHLDSPLLIGGGLITGASLLLLLRRTD